MPHAILMDPCRECHAPLVARITLDEPTSILQNRKLRVFLRARLVAIEGCEHVAQVNDLLAK